ncbi:hypothetical protein FHL15_007392 [Xylaria flabelliformis]|uniref:Terpene synthase n=1 Tax=Xylaria flabelliformis TaxID=2512241 RepID=A0A553HUH8_9PEZI|nr:hypothetical protein FHL15_007392 [Xylaria flabelliformis]
MSLSAPKGLNTANSLKGNHGTENSAKTRALRIPNLFAGILGGDAPRNPHEESIAPMSEAWTKELVKMDPKMSKILTKANFAYLISLSAPDADPEAFRMAVDWCIWAFVFDDQFDEGWMRDRTIESAEEMIETLAIMDDTYPVVDPKRYPLRYMFQTVWHRFQEVKINCRPQPRPDPDPDPDLLRGRSGADYRWSHGISLTQDILDHPSLVTCERAASDLTWLVNDVLSYKKDLAFGVEHNIICLYKRQGFSEQEAMDKTGDLMAECQRDWDDAIEKLPSWGDEVDKQVQRYLGACRDVARANMLWSFKSGRYLNADEAALVRKTSIMNVQ